MTGEEKDSKSWVGPHFRVGADFILYNDYKITLMFGVYYLL